MQKFDEDEKATMPVVESATVSAATMRWMQELGASVESLAQMMRSPTAERPFVYELRIDLLPVKGDDSLLVAKGFGPDGALVMFNTESGFLSLLKGTEGRLRSGKCTWHPDQYAPANYNKRFARYQAGGFYSLR